ncbi:FeoA family protein [Streptomyces kebangsaanensis]|uniref:FeoA family protein n=1 Tax=Streptomyces kebangsaanensis TaxID=864058 RepID=UPI0018FE9AAF|nr:FeoA family protein [Streptomyces kebangsaanensis]
MPVDSAPDPDARLADLRPGMSGQVIDIDESVEPSTARRLFDLGFAPGAEVTVLRKSPLGDPVVFQVVEYEVALRKAQAAGIHVRRIA